MPEMTAGVEPELKCQFLDKDGLAMYDDLLKSFIARKPFSTEIVTEFPATYDEDTVYYVIDEEALHTVTLKYIARLATQSGDKVRVKRNRPPKKETDYELSIVPVPGTSRIEREVYLADTYCIYVWIAAETASPSNSNHSYKYGINKPGVQAVPFGYENAAKIKIASETTIYIRSKGV